MMSLRRPREAAPIFLRLSEKYPAESKPRGGYLLAVLEAGLENGEPDDFGFKRTGDPATDIASAIALDHPNSDDEATSCDICEALKEGFVFSAAHLLIGAT